MRLRERHQYHVIKTIDKHVDVDNLNFIAAMNCGFISFVGDKFQAHHAKFTVNELPSFNYEYIFCLFLGMKLKATVEQTLRSAKARQCYGITFLVSLQIFLVYLWL